MTIYSQINSNKRKTAFIIVVFMLFISFLGYVLGEYYFGYGMGLGVMGMAFVFSAISALSSYFYSDKMVLGISGAKKADPVRDSNLYGILENLSIGSGLPKTPDLYIINDSAPNAFATGRDTKHSAIAVTTGLAQKLNKRQIEAVLAHEISHVKNYDILLMTIVVVLVGSVTMLANFLFRGRMFSSSDNNRGGGGIILLVGLALAIVSPIIAQLIKLAVSRSREYLADASASLLTRDPDGLAEALAIIANDPEPLEVANEATAHLYISNPLKKGVNADWFANLFSTHPPVQERIARLRAM